MESFSLYLYISNHKFHKSKLLNFTQEYIGSIFSYYSNINKYINLEEENKFLQSENAKLYTLLNRKDNKDGLIKYNYISCKVIKNSVFQKNNYIILNKGTKHGVKSGMGVMVDNGIVGIINSTSQHYSKVISILNQNSGVSIVHKKSRQNGSLNWKGKHYTTAVINDIPNHANINIGDTIQTNGYSSIFPEGINIATVLNFEKGDANGLYNIEIKFICDLNTIKNVYIIHTLDKEILEEL